MKLRADNSGDSLWLLLDTMCNAFGGMILVAMLLALVSNDERIEKETVRAREIAQQMTGRRVEQTQKDLQRAAQYNAELKAKISDPELAKAAEKQRVRDEWKAKTQQRGDDLAKVNETNKAVRAASSQSPQEALKELQGQIQKANEVKSKWEGALVHAHHEIAEWRERCAELTGKAKGESEKRTVKVRLPREQKSARDALYVILRYGRVYFPIDPTAEAGSRNTADVSWTPMGSDRVMVAPIRDRGLDPSTDSARALTLLRAVRSETHYIVFLTYEDSFRVFNQLKQQLVQGGKQYGWTPLSSDQPIVFTTGTPDRPGIKPGPM